MTTLVISDLHLGAHGDRAKLGEAEVRAALTAVLPDYDRLVLLGDIVEFREGPAWRSLADAQAILAPIAAALAPGTEVILTPGNHDHELLAPWLTRRAISGDAPPLGRESDIDWLPGESLAMLLDAFADRGARVRVAYPGLWLRDDVYAMHGHYLDRHSTVPAFERLAAGAMGKFLKSPLSDAHTAEDYEGVLGPIYAWMFSVAQYGYGSEINKLDGSIDDDAPAPASGQRSNASLRIWKLLNEGEGVGRMLASGGISAVTGLLSAAGLGPLRSEVNGEELYRAGVRGYAGVLEALGVRSRYALFGHTHRAGPLPGDDRDLWLTNAGTRLFNTGCWVNEEAYLGGDLTHSAYRAGFAIRLGDDGPPELINLLDG